MSNEVAPQRRQVYEKVESLTYTLNGMTIADAIITLNELQVQHNDKFDKLYFDLDYERDYGDSITVNLDLMGQRLENDKELAERLANEEARQRITQEREIAQLRELKQKYGF